VCRESNIDIQAEGRQFIATAGNGASMLIDEAKQEDQCFN